MPIPFQPTAAHAAGRIAAASLMPLAGVLLALTLGDPARAAEPIAFTIPAEDGYGIADCMQAGSACGQEMANSWCEAHGHLRAVAYGAADVTATTTAGIAGAPEAAGAVMIRCGD